MQHVIIGVGAAGIEAAKTIRKIQPTADITMISTDEYVHSRCMLHKYLSGERNEDTLSFIPQDFFASNNIKWLKNLSVQKIISSQNKIILSNNQEVTYDKLLIATGAHSFIPPIGHLKEAQNVFGLRDLKDAQMINEMKDNVQNILVIGSGLVGMDAAYAFLEQGKNVTVLEMSDRILPLQLDRTASEKYQTLFEEHGCKFILNAKATDTTINNTHLVDSVILEDGTKINCDLVLVATGVRPSIECLEDSSVKTDRFIKVNEYMQTSVPNIYGAGDVTGLSGIWPNAQKQGQIAGYNMCDITMQYSDSYAMKNTINFYGLTTLSLGTCTSDLGDQVIIENDSFGYKKAILKDNKLESILILGDIRYSGIYQYLIKNKIDLSDIQKNIFKLSFADFYDIDDRGQYIYNL